MRLFTAINFNRPIKNYLRSIQDSLRSRCTGGSFTLEDNLHLTLVFIGETQPGRVNSIKKVMDETEARPFTLVLKGVGKFPRTGGDLWWAGVERSEPLSQLQSRLSKELTAQGFDVDSRPYSPHLTLARQVKLKPGADVSEAFEGAAAQEFFVETISLMESKHVSGRLVYSEIYSKSLV